MLRIGLTGGIGSGKTTVARIFENLGVPVFYADNEAKRIMSSDERVISELVSLFGQEAFNGKSLNTQYIAEKVFRDRIMLERLNLIVHPAVHKQFLEWADMIIDKPYVLEEAAILFESGAFHYFDYNIMVNAPEQLRIQRVMDRDRVPEILVKERMNNQMPDDKKLLLTDFVIRNDDRSLVIPQVIELHKKLISLQP